MMETDKHDFNLIVITNILKRNNPIFKKPAESEYFTAIYYKYQYQLMKPSN